MFTCDCHTNDLVQHNRKGALLGAHSCIYVIHMVLFVRAVHLFTQGTLKWNTEQYSQGVGAQHVSMQAYPWQLNYGDA